MGWVCEEFLSWRQDAPAVSVRKQLRKVAVAEVIRIVSEVAGVSEEALRARGRHGNEARELAMYLAQRYCGETNVAIGMEFGGIAGTNVSYVSQKVKERLSGDREFRELCERAERNLFSEG